MNEQVNASTGVEDMDFWELREHARGGFSALIFAGILFT
jgi:hypothetical protein